MIHFASPSGRLAAVVLSLLLLGGMALGSPRTAGAATIPTAVGMTISPSPSHRGEFVTLRATVSPNPGGGSVTFWDMTPSGGGSLGNVPVDPATGVADMEARFFNLGTRDIDAVFNGYGEYRGSSIGPPYVDHEVRLRETATTLDISPFSDTGDITLSVTVSPVPDGGTVTIRSASGYEIVRDAPVNPSTGRMTYVHQSRVGESGYRAIYSGSFFYATSTSPTHPFADTRQPTTIGLDVTPEQGAPYDTWRYQADVDPDEPPRGGVVRIWSLVTGTSRLIAEGAPNPNGIFTTTGTYIVPGEATSYATYSGSPTYGPSASANKVVIIEKIVTTTHLALASSTIADGGTVEATVTVSPAPGTYPPSPVAGLTLTSRAGDLVFRAVAIDPASGIGSVTIDAYELAPEVWTARARFAEAPPTGSRYLYSESDAVELRYEPIGPAVTLSQAPNPVYVGEPLTLTATLDPPPSGGSVKLYSGLSESAITTLVATRPAAGTVAFPVTAVHGLKYRAVYEVSGALPARSRIFTPAYVWPPSVTFGSTPSMTAARDTWDFTWTASSSSPPVSFACRLDAGAWYACGSPHRVGPLPDGLHRFEVLGTDANGRSAASPTAHAWRIDTTAPVVTAVLNDGSPTNQSTVDLDLSVVEGGSGIADMLVSRSPATNSFGQLNDASRRPFASTSAVTFLPTGQTAEGEYPVYAQVTDRAGNYSAVASATIVYDTTAPAASIVLDDGAFGTRSALVTVRIVGATEPVSAVRAFNLGGWLGGTPKLIGPLTSFPWSLSDTAYGGFASEGQRTVEASIRDAAGNWSSPTTDSIVFDRTPPAVFGIEATIAAGRLGSTVPIRSSWQAVDLSTVVDVDIERRTGAGAWAAVPTGGAPTAVTQPLSPGVLHQYRVRATDTLGNLGVWTYGPTFRVTVLQETAGELTTSGAWSRRALSGASGGFVKMASARGVAATVRFTANDIGLVMTRAASRGSATATIDGIAQGTLNLHSSVTRTRGIVFVRSFDAAQARALRLGVLGTSGHPWVDVDAVILITEH